MLIEDMINILELCEIKYINNNDSIQEYHDYDEDYYELDYKNSTLYYVIKERANKTELIHVFGTRSQAVSCFCMLMLSKKVLKRIRDKVNKSRSQVQRDNIGGMFHLGEDYDFEKNTNVDINCIASHEKYTIYVYREKQIVYSSIYTDQERATSALIRILYENKELNDIMFHANYAGIYSEKLTEEEYEMFFNPYDYLHNLNK